MGVYYHYVNFTKRERFAIDALGGGLKFGAIGHTPAARAFHLMLTSPTDAAPAPARGLLGRWAGDGVAVVGDDVTPDWERIRDGFSDVQANAILISFYMDGFEQLALHAGSDQRFFMQLCHLVTTHQAIDLDPCMRQRFGPNYLRHYKELFKSVRFEPRDVVVAAGS